MADVTDLVVDEVDDEMEDEFEEVEIVPNEVVVDEKVLFVDC